MTDGARLGTILIAEDDVLLRRMLRRALTSHGWSVVEAVDGLDALELLRGTAVNLVLTDVDMPRMGGRELTLAVNARLPGLPVVLMSGNPLVDTSDVSPWFIPKPFAPKTMERVLAAALAAHAQSAVG